MFKKSRKALTLSILVLLVILIIGGVSYALTYKTLTTEHEMLNTGVIFVWSDGNGNWQNGLKPNGSCNRNFKVNIGADRTDIQVFDYNSANFGFGNENISHWNKTKKCKGKTSYNSNYVPYSTQSENISFDYNKKTGELKINQRVTLSSAKIFDVAYYVKEKMQHEVYNYLGDNVPSTITEPMNQMLTDHSVKGYLYFCPVVINYKEQRTEVVEEPLELKAKLELPSKGETKTPYTVKDATVIPKGGTFQSSLLEKSVDGGATYVRVNDWDCKTENAEMQEENSLAIQIKYRLTVMLKSGETSTDEKAIILEEDKPNVNVSADVDLKWDGPIGENGYPIGYTGHPNNLTDYSKFYITTEDGKKITLSAREAYAKGIASYDYSFDSPRSDYSVKKFNSVEREVVYESPGLKTATLTVTLKDGVKYSDIIEIKM